MHRPRLAATLSEMSGAAFDVVGDPADAGPFLFICEHASNAVPAELIPSVRDHKRLEEHWGYDIGTRELVTALVAELGGQGVLCGFSRLVADTNRLPTEESLVLKSIDGQPVDFNHGIRADERLRRMAVYFEGYHQGVEGIGRARAALDGPFHLVSVHSFTPTLDGVDRPMEIGILYDDYDDEAEGLKLAFEELEFVSALNEPYSGRPPSGLMYSAQRHGWSLDVKYLELEIRQDLIDEPYKARATAKRLAKGLLAFCPEAPCD